MNNDKLLKTVLAKEAIIILGLTLLGYCSVFSLEAGFASFYGFSISFIDIGMINIFENIMLRIFPSATMAFLFILCDRITSSYKIANLVVKISLFVATIIVGYIAYNDNLLFAHIVNIVFFIFLSFSIIFFQIIINRTNASNLLVITFLFLFVIFSVFGFYGWCSASCTRYFNAFNYNNKSYVILKVYNNSIIANELINGTLSKNILYIPSNKAEIIELKPFQRIERN